MQPTVRCGLPELIIAVDARIVDSLGFRLGNVSRLRFLLKLMDHGRTFMAR